ncbi:pyridoxal phosphate-dependent aminotransferase [Candidatus Woesearchaeota archaeon]|nr:pyridoxal phosphate-dependent aminotransferase [Candidatus Woesearchaeota archaeon]
MGFNPSHRLDGIEISIIRKINALAKPSTINLGIGQLPYRAPGPLIQAGIKALEKGVIQYTTNAGNAELRQLIAEEHPRLYERGVNPEDVIITTGVEEALSIVFAASLNPGDEVLIPEIYFSVYDPLARFYGATPRTYKLDETFSLDLEDIESKINPRTKIIVINSPANPTGKILRQDELSNLAEIILSHRDLYAVSDEVYSHLYFGEEKPQSIARYSGRVIITDGISKRSSATGLRIGWTIAPQEVTRELIKVHQYMVTCASSISQAAAIPVLRGECLESEEKYRRSLKENRDSAIQLLSEIPDMDLVSPEGAFYCFPNISRFGDSMDVSLKLLNECDVLTIPGIAFGEKGKHHIRLSYAVGKEKLCEGITRMQKVLQ